MKIKKFNEINENNTFDKCKLYIHSNGIRWWIKDDNQIYKVNDKREGEIRGINQLNGYGIYFEIDMDSGKILNWDKERFIELNNLNNEN